MVSGDTLHCCVISAAWRRSRLGLRIRVLASTTGRGAKGSATKPSCATWSGVASWICCRIANRRPSPNGCALYAPPEIISRDRAGAYAEAARQGAPHAIQVADRFYLLRNLREAVERVLTRHGPLIEEAFRQSTSDSRSSFAPPSSKDNFYRPFRSNSAAHVCKGRFARYQQVVELHEQGVSKRAIALQLGLNRKTVRGWLHAGRFPERQVTQRRSAVDRWLSYLEMRWAEGCHNRSQLWRELRGQERGLPRSPCAAGSVCASGSVGAVPRVRFLHPGNVLVRGKRVRSCSVSFATQLPRNRNSPKPFAGFLPRLPPPQN